MITKGTFVKVIKSNDKNPNRKLFIGKVFLVNYIETNNNKYKYGLLTQNNLLESDWLWSKDELQEINGEVITKEEHKQKMQDLKKEIIERETSIDEIVEWNKIFKKYGVD